jgi:hypothetical protein
MRSNVKAGWLTAAAVLCGSLSACSSGQDTTRAAGPSAQASEGSTRTDEAAPTLERGPVEPGRYSARVADTDDSWPRPVLDVPAGFTANGNFAVLRDKGRRGGSLGIGFWAVEGVPEEPCAAQAYLDPGPSVEDLAKALADQTQIRTTQPRPTTLDGHHGIYLEATVPTNLDVPGRCFQQRLNLWRDTGGGYRWLSERGDRARLWILDVNGHRIVVDAFDGTGHTPADITQVTQMVESIDFTKPPTG